MCPCRLQHNPLVNGTRPEALTKQLLYMHTNFHTKWNFKKRKVVHGVRVWQEDGCRLDVPGHLINKTFGEGTFSVVHHPFLRRVHLVSLLCATLVAPAACAVAIMDVAMRVPGAINKPGVPAMWCVVAAAVTWVVHVRVFAMASVVPVASCPDLPASAWRARRALQWCCLRPRGHLTPVMLATLARFLVRGTIEPVRVDLRSNDLYECGAMPGMLPVLWLGEFLGFGVCIPMFLLVSCTLLHPTPAPPAGCHAVA